MNLLIFPIRMRGNPYFQIFLEGLQDAGVTEVRLSNVLRFRSNFDAMHLHHPEHAVTQESWMKSGIVSAALLSVALYAKLTGRPIIWMVQDVEPAWVRRKALLAAFMMVIIRLTTAYVFLNKSSQQIFYTKNPQEIGKPFCLTPHSRFKTTVFDDGSVKKHRETHGIQESDILISFLARIIHQG